MHEYCTPNDYYYHVTQLYLRSLGRHNSVYLSVRLTNPKNLPAIFLYHILITANIQSETGFPSSQQLKSYVASKLSPT